MAPAETLSIVLPAYNEALRLPRYLAELREYLETRPELSAEVIVVDDGSEDGLDRAIEAQSTAWPVLRLVRHDRNRGKGAAVRTGMLAARGEVILFADADGATPIAEEAALRAAIDAGADVAIGSRLIDAPTTRRRRRWSRAISGRLFAAVARRMLGLSIRDTQCGFKMFRLQAARELFGRLEETGFLFDLEVLALASRLGYRVVEVPIDWTEIAGGHFHPWRAWPGVAAGLWRLRRRLARSRLIATGAAGLAGEPGAQPPGPSSDRR